MELPPQPERPLDGECCECECDPCVWDLYYDAMREWREQVAQIKAQTDDSAG